MSGYTPVFRTVFEGSLCGQYPDTAAWLFLLALADKNGNVDKTPQYIAAVTGMPVDDLVACIGRFMQPDPASRSEAEEGRRLVPIDPARTWGWRIVNHGKYREKARLEAKNARDVEAGKEAERKRLGRGLSVEPETDEPRDSARDSSPDSTADPPCPPVSAAVRRIPPVSDPSNANANPDVRGRASAPRRGRRCPPEFEPDRQYALREIPDLDAEREVQKFRDCEFAKPRSDWPATWRNWIATCRDTGRYARRVTNRIGNGGDWT